MPGTWLNGPQMALLKLRYKINIFTQISFVPLSGEGSIQNIIINMSGVYAKIIN